MRSAFHQTKGFQKERLQAKQVGVPKAIPLASEPTIKKHKDDLFHITFVLFLNLYSNFFLTFRII